MLLYNQSSDKKSQSIPTTPFPFITPPLLVVNTSVSFSDEIYQKYMDLNNQENETLRKILLNPDDEENVLIMGKILSQKSEAIKKFSMEANGEKKRINV